jgi:hypothetical protein
MNEMLKHINDIRELFGEDGEHWCKHSLALTTNGDLVVPTNPKAVAWCLIGATEKLGLSLSFLGILGQQLMKLKNIKSLSAFNDSPETVFQDIIDFLDRVEERYRNES